MPLAKARQGESVGFHLYDRVSNEGTLANPETIIWSSIRHLCSRGFAESLAPLHGTTKKRDRRAVGFNLKLYIQQASEFYDAARAAKPNTAPLIHYYSFLNLAKALCELHYPRFHERQECYRHGLSWKPNPRRLVDLDTETVSITTRGVWHLLWEVMTLTPCVVANPTRLRVKDLLSYCPEINVEGARLGILLRLFDFEKPDVLYDKSTLEAWIRFSLLRVDFKGSGVSAPKLIAQIQTTRSEYVEVESADKRIRTFQSRTPKRLGRHERALAGLHNDIVGLNVFTHLAHGQLQYFLPEQKRLPIRLPQLVVSYTILFWLGSLVRYDPHSVRALMDSEYWILIDGFMSQSRLWLLELFEWAFYQAETTLLTPR